MMYKFLLFHILVWLGLNGCSGASYLSPWAGSHRPITDRPTRKTPGTPNGQSIPVRCAIIHGKKAPDKSMLYMASVQNNRHKHICGGFLISENFVVTAAQCEVNIEKAMVVLGTHNLQTVEKKVKYIIKKCNPSYESNGWNDIMLLKLDGNNRKNIRVDTIPLPTSEMNIKEKEKCHVAGWGITETGNISSDLRVVDVSVINLEVCKNQLPGLPANVICAGGYDTDKGFCRGDSGGPLVCNGVAVGVASVNKSTSCDYPGVPNVYTDIRKFRPWIDNILQKNDC